MELNSCLYECNVMHCRVKPKEHKFNHKIFMFYLNLDEIDDLTEKMILMSRNQPAVYNFCDSDHLELGGKTVKENILTYIKSKGVDLRGGRIMLLTNVRTMGYSFNPVSFYFCFDRNNEPVCVVPEIGNTYGELKPYFIGKEALEDSKFRSEQTKYYYISPFIGLDVPLDFQLKIPDEKLNIRIDDLNGEGKFLYATLTGRRKELSNANLFWYSICFPFVTLKIITLIHWHAAILHYIKKIPHHAKESNPHLQKEVYRAWSKN